MKNKVVLFEIPASDFKKAKEFYEAVFDWKVELWGTQGAMALTTAALERWKQGTTGLPLVDAGMRQLLREGWMHNRARMVVASFLTRRLGIAWQDGAAHFMRYLVDGDPANNAGGKVVTAKHPIDEWGFMADFADPEGNVFSLWEKPKK